MHPQMSRLYEAARLRKQISRLADVAAHMGESSQTVKNWEKRGISNGGLLAAQKAFGCRAEWLETCIGPMSDTTSPSPALVAIDLDNNPDYPAVRRVHIKASGNSPRTGVGTTASTARCAAC